MDVVFVGSAWAMCLAIVGMVLGCDKLAVRR